MKGRSKTTEKLIQETVSLKRTIQELKDLLENLHDVIYATDTAGVVTYISPGVETISGYRPEEIIGKSFIDFVHPEDRRDRMPNFLKALAGEAVATEYRFVTKANSIVWVQTKARPRIQDGEVKGLQGVLFDITDRKVIEEGLRQSREKYSTIIESIEDGYYEVDLAGNFTFFNEALQRITGFTREELLGLNYRRYAADDQTARHIYQAYNDVYRTGEPNRGFECEVYRKDGARRTVDVSVSLIRDAVGHPQGFRGIVRDITERRRMEESLKESEERYRQLFEAESDAIFLIENKTGSILEANSAASSLYGYSREELLTKKNVDLSAEPEEAQLVARSTSTMRERVVTGLLRHHRKKDGTVFPVEITGRFFNWHGRPVHIAAIRDITERKRAEETLKLDESRLQALVNISTMHDRPLEEMLSFALEQIVQLTNSEAGYLAFPNADETVLTIHSWSRKAMKECRLRYTTRDCSMEQAGLWAEPVRQRKAIITNDYKAANPLKKGYPRRHFKSERHIGVPLVVDNRVVMTAGVANKAEAYDDTDARQVTLMLDGIWKIIQQHRTEDFLRASRQLLLDIIDALPDATLIIDKEGKVMAWNRAIETMTGVPADDMIGKGDYEYALPFYGERRPILIDFALHPDPELEKKQYTAIQRQGDILFGEAYVPKLAPGNIHLSGTASVLRDLRGEIVAAIECVRNNTDRKKLESQLQQAQKMEAVGTLAAGIAHDFNNLLSGIMGHSALMEIDPRFPANHRGRLKAIAELVQSATGLTSQLLGFSRMGRYEVKTWDMNEILRKTAALFGRTRKEIIIREQLSEELLPVEVDRTQMEQVFMNLFVNAWQAMPEGGTLDIATANVTIHDDEVRKSYMTPGSYVKIAVTDSGEGMDEATKRRIFEPFFTTREMGRGTGLGLAMVYGIVKGHNGYINVYSEKGHGTTFNIYLPASERQPKQEEEAMQPKLLKGDETILIVDDEQQIIDIMVDILNALGYTVLEARSGEEALEIYKREKDKIDLVILDMVMPGMSGGETFNHLKKLNPDIRVILSSGYSLNGAAQKIIKRGCRAFIQKPATIAEISQKVREVLDGS
ncbi:MAG: PAS domain S-box protein [Syntrophales bacterium]